MKNNANFKGTQLELLEKYELKKWHKGLINRCEEKGIIFLSTPFENESYKFLTELNLPIIKISSGDLTNTPFLSKVAHGQAQLSYQRECLISRKYIRQRKLLSHLEMINWPYYIA